MAESAEPFFRRNGGALVPTDRARGPWNPATLHGRVIVGILAAEVERQQSADAFFPARLTVDMHRVAKFAPVTVETELVRDGPRIRLVDAVLLSHGELVGRASCQMLRQTENPAGGTAWQGETWDVPMPDAIPPTAIVADVKGLWETRTISGALGELSQRRLWMRENRELIGGEELSPFARLAAGADFVSPLANYGDGPGYTFINSDLTLYIHRLPIGEWIGYESVAHEASAGIGIGHCNLYDVEGRIGWGSICGLAQSLLQRVR